MATTVGATSDIPPSTSKGSASVTTQTELNTITSTMNELSTRITALVETSGSTLPSDVYTELIAAERTIGTLLRRLNRVAGRISS
ncbi:MAG: hypothetical protein ABSC34_02260 [Acidimicrobiales bacterium]